MFGYIIVVIIIIIIMMFNIAYITNYYAVHKFEQSIIKSDQCWKKRNEKGVSSAVS